MSYILRNKVSRSYWSEYYGWITEKGKATHYQNYEEANRKKQYFSDKFYCRIDILEAEFHNEILKQNLSGGDSYTFIEKNRKKIYFIGKPDSYDAIYEREQFDYAKKIVRLLDDKNPKKIAKKILQYSF